MGSDTDYWYDTTMSVSGHTLALVSFNCGTPFDQKSYGFTASGEDLSYFAFSGGLDGTGELLTIVSYRRTCRR